MSYVNLSDNLAPFQIAYYVSSSNTEITSTSTTWANTDISITPPQGTYVFMYTGSLFCEGAGATIGQTRLTKNNVEIPGTNKQTRNTVVMVLGLIGGNNIDAGACATSGVVSCNGTEVIRLQLSRGGSGSNINLRNRSLIMIKVS